MIEPADQEPALPLKFAAQHWIDQLMQWGGAGVSDGAPFDVLRSRIA